MNVSIYDLKKLFRIRMYMQLWDEKVFGIQVSYK